MSVIEFLDHLDATRETRTMGRPDVNQMSGFREDWNDYVSSWVEDNSDWQ